MTLVALLQMPLTEALVGFALGLALGLVHFLSLRTVTALYLDGGSTLRALALQLIRLALLGGGLVALALLGALPLLTGAAGVLVARQIVLRRSREDV